MNLEYSQIEDVVREFYKVALSDFMIGYHFHKILTPENFENHIKRIANFWELHLTGKISNKSHLPYDLIKAHIPLNIKLGEVGRWEILFNQTLDDSGLPTEATTPWKAKIRDLKMKMLAHPKLFQRK